jgi:hypothetical protein
MTRPIRKFRIDVAHLSWAMLLVGREVVEAVYARAAD